MQGGADEKAILERLVGILHEMFEIEPAILRPQATLRGTLRLDSADLVDLAVRVEQEFAIEPDHVGDRYRNVSTLRELAAILARETAKRAAIT